MRESYQLLTKLSDIWDWADKNLIQIQGKYGLDDGKSYCAIGAICYYLSNGKYRSPEKLLRYSPNEYSIYKKLIKTPLLAVPVIILNDLFGMKFKTMASLARKLNL